MSEELLVMHCSPTLAGIKTGSLFSCSFVSNEEIMESVRTLNRRLASKGLRVLPVRIAKGKALIYVYRPKKLMQDFTKKPVREILEELGYVCDNPGQCVIKLMNKLHNEPEFPHEIGLFLGYPAEDVRGFIDNKAACSKCLGCWKVYGDPHKAKKVFSKYRKCTRVYCEQWRKGKTIERLTVAG